MALLPVIAIYYSSMNWFQLRYADQTHSIAYKVDSTEARQIVEEMNTAERSALGTAIFSRPEQWVAVS